MVDEISLLKCDIAFNVMYIAEILNSMADGQRLIDQLKDEEDIMLAREIIHEQENLVREIMEDTRDKNATIKRLEKLSGTGSGNQQPRIDSGAGSQGPTPIQGEMQPSRA